MRKKGVALFIAVALLTAALPQTARASDPYLAAYQYVECMDAADESFETCLDRAKVLEELCWSRYGYAKIWCTLKYGFDRIRKD